MSIALVSKENEPRLSWSCNLNGISAGKLSVIPVELKLGSRKIKAGWAVDFMTLAEYRRRGIGSALVKEANMRFDMFLAVGATEMSFALFNKMGWRYVGDLPHYVKVWDIGYLLEQKLSNIFIGRLAALPAAFVLGLFNFLKRPSGVKGIKVETLDSFSSEADTFWDSICGFYRIAVARNSDYLRRKYDAQPDLGYLRFRASRKGSVCGYAVARCVKNRKDRLEGLITDIITRPTDRDAIQALVYAVSRYLKSRGCLLARGYFSDKRIQQALSDSGFLKRKSYLPFLLKENIETGEEIYNLDNWFLSAGDSDIDRG